MNEQLVEIYVGNLSKNVQPYDLRKVFSRYGRLKYCRIIHSSRRLSEARGYSFICFEKSRDAEEAIIKENGRELKGKCLRLEWALRNGHVCNEVLAKDKYSRCRIRSDRRCGSYHRHNNREETETGSHGRDYRDRNRSNEISKNRKQGLELLSKIITNADGRRRLEFKVNLSQYKPEDIQVIVYAEYNVLIIQARHERAFDDGGYLFYDYVRELPLPNNVVTDEIESILDEDGTLTVQAKLPSVQHSQPHILIPITYV